MSYQDALVKHDNAQGASTFFVLKVREEKQAGGPIEWRGEILHVDSGRTSSFEDWPEMVDAIADALHSLRPQLAGVTGSDLTAE